MNNGNESRLVSEGKECVILCNYSLASAIKNPSANCIVCGPGVLHATAGVGNSMLNATYPLLLLAGGAEASAGPTKGAFQQLDAVSLLAPHTKFAVRSPSLEDLPQSIRDAYRFAFYGRPGVGFVDLPADYIQGVPKKVVQLERVEEQPRILGDERRVMAVAEALKRAETIGTDVVLLVSAWLNWMLHFGEPPKWSAGVRIAQIDISPEELDRGITDPTLSIHGDITAVIPQLKLHLTNYHRLSSLWSNTLSTSAAKNLAIARAKASTPTNPLTYHRTFALINIFTVSQPHQRVDVVGTYAAMEPSGFSLPEIETMSRYRLPIIIFVINNEGVYHGISNNTPSWGATGKRRDVLLTSTALGSEAGYDVVAGGLGGRGWKVVDEKGLVRAVQEAWEHRDGPSVVNVIVASGVGGNLEFGWGRGKEGRRRRRRGVYGVSCRIEGSE
ncbi:putative 2-hydroxyphytanoyl-CoA lyase [Tuber indicum]|nr:putative 2-hydroxyphytanoyl-CoA lyase [Tuber indicum]